MKLFLKTTKYESEITPDARLAIVTVLGHNDKVVRRMCIWRTPFKRWVKFINPWSFQHDCGWCTLTCGIIYGSRVRFVYRWDPLHQYDRIGKGK